VGYTPGMVQQSAQKLLSLTQMARRLRVTAKWLREETEAGRVPHLQAGHRLLFNADAVERVLLARASNYVGPESATSTSETPM
jgi:hypothetical protein